MSEPKHYMDQFLNDDFDVPVSMTEYLKGEGLRLESELKDEIVQSELKRQFWVDQIGKTIDACDGRGGKAVGRLLAVCDGATLPKATRGYSGDLVALQLDVEGNADVRYWPAGMCRVIAA